MANYQFEILLKNSGLSAESMHNLWVIFPALSDERKIELMDNWPAHLDTFLKIEKKGSEERKKNIESALSKIESIINDALERDRQKALQADKKQQEAAEWSKGATVFDNQLQTQEQQKKFEMLRNIWRTMSDDAPSPLFDPLWNL